MLERRVRGATAGVVEAIDATTLQFGGALIHEQSVGGKTIDAGTKSFLVQTGEEQCAINNSGSVVI